MMDCNEGNKVALVTGGSRGIGRAISVRLAETGTDTVVINYLRNDMEAEKTRELIEQQKSRCVLLKANLAYPDEINNLFKDVRRHVDRLDAFIHCAAIGAMKPTIELRPNQWDLTMNVNARAFLLCVQNCVPLMKQGRIVALSSLGSVRAVPNYGATGVSKAALESIVRYLGVDLAPRGIRVNAVSGGFVETDSIGAFPEAERLIKETVRRTPAGRIGKPDDISEVVMFLISSSAKWIYGQTLIADGGLSLT